MGKNKPLSAAEKQRRYRGKRKLNKEKVEENKKKDLERYHNKKRLISDMKIREARLARRKWRTNKKNYRERVKKLKAVIDITPPSSPSTEQVGNVVCGRKKMRMEKAKVHRKNIKLQVEVNKLKKKVEKLKKQRQRSKKVNIISSALSPLSKTNELINTCLANVRGAGVETVKKNLLKYATLTEGLKNRYAELRTKSQKEGFKSILSNKLIRKYKLKMQFHRDVFNLTRVRKSFSKTKPNADILSLQRFYERDDISRATAGKKETRTKLKQKLQKRYLLDTLQNIYKKYKSEGGRYSYSYFAAHRPFYVVSPTVASRDTCACKLHVNFELKLSALKQINAIHVSNLNELLMSVVCDMNSKRCMYNECTSCKNKTCTLSIQNESEVAWKEWIRKEEQFEKNEKVTVAIKMIREEHTTTTSLLAEKFSSQLQVFKKHIFNIRTQHKAYRSCIDQLKTNEAVLHVDFSENYSCKMGQEIQSHHFGSSRNQITLHTGVLYFSGKVNLTHSFCTPINRILYFSGENNPFSFCTISACNEHSPSAIWAHLQPIFDLIRNSKKDVNTIHIFSDGPCTQYRQKQNFYLFGTKLFENGFQLATWNFFEAAHGKGAADGIGGVLKRVADRMVAHGADIMNSQQFFEQVQKETTIKLFLIDKAAIDCIRKTLPSNIPLLKGTMRLHQLMTKIQGTVLYRDVSCFCSNIPRGFCSCFESKVYKTNLIRIEDEKTTQKKLIYKEVYTPSSSEDESEKENTDIENKNGIMNGTFLLIQVLGKSITYRYVCIAQTCVDEDGYIKVMFLRSNDSTSANFRIEENDISYIQKEAVIKILENANIKLKGGRIYYNFNHPIDILEAQN